MKTLLLATLSLCLSLSAFAQNQPSPAEQAEIGYEMLCVKGGLEAYAAKTNASAQELETLKAQKAKIQAAWENPAPVVAQMSQELLPPATGLANALAGTFDFILYCSTTVAIADLAAKNGCQEEAGKSYSLTALNAACLDLKQKLDATRAAR